FGDVHTHVMDVATKSVLGGQTSSPGFRTWTHDGSKMIATTFKGAKPGPGPGGGAVDTSFAVWDGNGATQLATLSLGTLEATQPDLSKDDGTLVFVVPAAGTIDKSGDHHFTGGSLYTASFDNANNTIGAPAQLLAANGRNYYYP